MRSILVSLVLVSTLVSAESEAPVVKSVSLRGTLLKVALATQVGQQYNADTIDRDMHRLWSTGRFGDICVRTAQQPDGTDVIFDVVEAPRPSLHKTPPVDSPHLHIKAVNFIGDPGIDPVELQRALRALKARRIIPRFPGLWTGWRLLPEYSRDAIDSDLGRLRSLYLSKGYFDSTVRVDSTELSEKNAVITFFARSGPQSETSEPIPQVCSSLLTQRRDAERQGILDFAPTLHVQRTGDSSNFMNAATTVDHGPPYRIGRIEFTGNRHYSDALVRGNLLIDEGQLLDEHLLRKSAERINRAEIFEPINAASIAIHTNERTGVANIDIHLKERKHGSWLGWQGSALIYAISQIQHRLLPVLAGDRGLGARTPNRGGRSRHEWNDVLRSTGPTPHPLAYGCVFRR